MRKLSVPGVISDTLRLYWAALPLLAVTVAITELPISYLLNVSNLSDWDYVKRQMQLEGLVRPLVVGPLFVLLLALVHGERLPMVKAIRTGCGRFFALWLTNLLSGLLTMIGAICLILPGIYFLVIYSLAETVTVTERRSGPEALERSSSLVKGNFWRIMAVGLLMFLVPGGLGFSAGFALELLAGLDNLAMNVGLDYVFSLVSEVTTVAMFVCYWHLTRDAAPVSEEPAEPGLTPA